ncbi:MAG: hypothetical protein P4L40_11445 [Terracidiphilus sp.]|nr:hypothetical protein [Terracidiphilus sp.]
MCVCMCVCARGCVCVPFAERLRCMCRLCRLTSHNYDITHLDLSGCSDLNLEAMRALNTLPHVATLNLSDNAGWESDCLVRCGVLLVFGALCGRRLLRLV